MMSHTEYRSWLPSLMMMMMMMIHDSWSKSQREMKKTKVLHD